MKPAFSPEELRAMISYDAESGEIRWIRPHASASVGKLAGGLNSYGYLRLQVCRKSYGAHRLAWYYTHGEWPVEIDHLNGVRHDNRLVNLRAADRIINMQNTLRKNAIGLPGITFYKPGNSWRAQIRVRGAYINLGLYATPEEASSAYIKAKQLHHPSFASGQGANS